MQRNQPACTCGVQDMLDLAMERRLLLLFIKNRHHIIKHASLIKESITMNTRFGRTVFWIHLKNP